MSNIYNIIISSQKLISVLFFSAVVSLLPKGLKSTLAGRNSDSMFLQMLGFFSAPASDKSFQFWVDGSKLVISPSELFLYLLTILRLFVDLLMAPGPSHLQVGN